jgi:uncharacterized protein (DUF1330 family)
MKMIGLIKLLDVTAFEAYRHQVGATLAPYGGVVRGRGTKSLVPWNELACGDFDAWVEIEFENSDQAERWIVSPEYTALLAIRQKAMKLTLFGLE